MLQSRFGRALMLAGAGIGVVSVVVTALELRMNLPDWMVRVAMIKLAFVASGGLLAAGALIGRHAKSRSLPSPKTNLLPDERPESFGQRPPNVEEQVMRRGQHPERSGSDELEPG